MKRLPVRPSPYHIVFSILIGGFLLYAILLTAAQPVHALPEYAARTGEACATCHVSPGGGGPRTLRGLLWAARGQPDQVPTLPGVLVAPGVADGAELYDIACAACHGQKGEGIFGVELRSTALKEGKIRSAILRGKTRSGMPAFEGQFTDEQLEALVTFVTGLADGEIQPPPDTYLLPPAQLIRAPKQAPKMRGGN